MHEIGHILGMNVELMKFFRDPQGIPLTPRPFEKSEELCVNGERREEYKPACNTLEMEMNQNGVVHYEVVLPTVKQVVRNQFDCAFLQGARLENQPRSDMSCFGDNWDQRLYLMEAMSSPALNTDFYFSPLTLAIMEDSGWYKANYTSEYVKINPFGHGAGCDFVLKDCITENGASIPDYAEGFFCNKQLKYTELGMSIFVCFVVHLYQREQLTFRVPST